MREARDIAARSATLTIMGLPPKSASGLSGKRVDAMRAGIMTVKLMDKMASEMQRLFN
jgi:hypothetical protein